VQRFFQKPLRKLGGKVGPDEYAVIGIITIAVNMIPLFSFVKKMSDRGFVLCNAFMVCGAFVMGDHLAFQTAIDPAVALPMVLGKLAGAFFAVLLALFLTRSLKKDSAEECTVE